MDYVKGTTGLTLPKQTAPLSNRREISAKTIEKWRNQLPISDMRSSAKALYVTLQECHQVPLSYQERFDILSLLRPTLSYICTSLQKFYSTREVLNENQRAIADLVNMLNFEMINGYKLVIEDVSNGFLGKQSILIASLQNALTYCSKIIFYSYEQHRSTPDGLWLELHTLFALSENQHVSQKSLKHFFGSQIRHKTLADIYKQCLLFSVANPHHLRQAQMAQLYYALETWAPLLELKDNDKQGACLFIVDMTQDSPPRYAGLYQTPPVHAYFLDLENVNDRLEKLLSARKINHNEKKLKRFAPSELELPYAHIDSILSSWRSLRERAHDRKKAQGKMTVCLGISACHWYLSQEKGLPVGETRESIFMSREEINMDMLEQPGQQTPSTSSKHPQISCEIINQSPKGICLKWSHDIPPQLQSGEVIGLESEIDSRKVWSIGTIKWLKNESPQATLIGIELLSVEALPVKARPAETTTQYAIPCIMLPEQTENNKPLRLITPLLPFKIGNEIEIEYDSQIFNATLLKSYGASSSYQEFGLNFALETFVYPHKVQDKHLEVVSAQSAPAKE